MKKSRKTIIVVTPLPPPVGGAELSTLKIIRCLKTKAKVIVYNLSSGRENFDFFMRTQKFIRAISTAFLILLSSGVKGKTLYKRTNSNNGLFYDFLFALIGRFKGLQVVFHHHCYNSIHKYDWRMALSKNLMQNSGLHIFLCENMRGDFQRLYGKLKNSIITGNFGIVDEVSEKPQSLSSNEPLVLGHISNLCFEKGIYEVVRTFKRCYLEGLNVRLILAGPPRTQEVKKYLETLTSQFPHRTEWRGAVYGDQKKRFFRDIDVFLFPSLAKYEAQPRVLIEALSYGVPVIAYGIACVPDMLDQKVGYVVPCEKDFSEVAYEKIKEWNSSSQILEKMKKQAFEHSKNLRERGVKDLNKLIDILVNV